MPKYLVNLSRTKREDCVVVIQAPNAEKVRRKMEEIERYAGNFGDWFFGEDATGEVEAGSFLEAEIDAKADLSFTE